MNSDYGTALRRFFSGSKSEKEEPKKVAEVTAVTQDGHHIECFGRVCGEIFASVMCGCHCEGDIGIAIPRDLQKGINIDEKNSNNLATMTIRAELDAFSTQIRKLGVYQQRQGVAAGVEVVSVQGFSVGALNELQKLKNAGYDITWRSLQ